jgi:hypothetical protein
MRSKEDITSEVRCRSCGELVDPRRVELGYDYCTRDECQERCLQLIEMARVGVNKAADQFVPAAQVHAPHGPSASAGQNDEADVESIVGASARPHLHQERRNTSPAERLRRAEARLDAALVDLYELYRHGELTARELDIERNRLIRAFNRLVRAQNIRYRSRLRAELPT